MVVGRSTIVPGIQIIGHHLQPVFVPIGFAELVGDGCLFFFRDSLEDRSRCMDLAHLPGCAKKGG